MTLKPRLILSTALTAVTIMAAPACAQEADRSSARQGETYTYAAPNNAPMSFADLIEEVSPAVVSIEASGTVERGEMPDMSQLPPQFREFFERFGGLPGQQAPRARRSQGSGFFISADGYVVTNNHVIEGADDISVGLADGRNLAAEVVGTDPATDLALLRVTEGQAPFAYVELDRDLDIRVGDWVVAVGNPFGLGGTATAGIVSASGRQMGPQQAYTDFLQIDAPINRGNSGGPTFDLNGNVVGVNSAIISPTGGNVGIGFAIPSDLAAQVVDQLIETGQVRRGYLGVSPSDLTDDLKDAMGLDADVEGVLINQVIAGTPAARAGFENGDIVTEIEGRPVDGARELTRRVGAVPPGDTVRFTVLRDGRERTLRVELAERPGEDELQNSGPAVEPGQLSMFGMVLEAPDADARERLDLGDRGLLVASVEPGSEAERKGLRPGDAIVEAVGSDVTSVDDFRAAVEDARERGRAAVLVYAITQSGQGRYVALELEEEE
ncbi:MAG: Do family serine endopeptidase [Oceanicaulis sp.]